MKPLFIILSVLLLITLTSAELEIGYNTNTPKVVMDIPDAPINYSTIATVNSSKYWDGLNSYNTTQMDDGSDSQTLTIQESWLTTFGNNIWCALTGCTMSGDIDMDGNDIFNVNQMNASFFNWTTGDIWNTFDGSTLLFNDTQLNLTTEQLGDARYIRNNFDNNYIALVDNLTAEDWVVVNSDRSSAEGLILYGSGAYVSNLGGFIEWHSNTGAGGTDEITGYTYVNRDVAGGDYVWSKTKHGTPTAKVNFADGTGTFGLGNIELKAGVSTFTSTAVFDHVSINPLSSQYPLFINPASYFAGSRMMQIQVGVEEPLFYITSTGDMAIKENMIVGATTGDSARLFVEGHEADNTMLRLKRFNTGSGGANFDMYHASDGDNGDDLGIINFLGLNSAFDEFLYARLKTNIVDVTEGAEIGKVSFGIANGQGGETDIMTLIGDGNTTIDSNLTVTGKIHNSLSHMYGLATAIHTVANPDVWYNITMNVSVSNFTQDTLSFHNNQTIELGHDGHYTITFGMGFKCSDNSDVDVAMRIKLNDEEMRGSYVEEDMANNQDKDEWLEHVTHFEGSAGDNLTMQYIASNDCIIIQQDDTYATQGFSAFGYLQEVIT